MVYIQQTSYPAITGMNYLSMLIMFPLARWHETRCIYLMYRHTFSWYTSWCHCNHLLMKYFSSYPSYAHQDLCRVTTSHSKMMASPQTELDRIYEELRACGVPVPNKAEVMLMLWYYLIVFPFLFFVDWLHDWFQHCLND